MPEKYNNKYRIESHRMPGWDYSCNGLYFITMVTQNRECILGEIENNEMILSDYGKLIEIEWYKSFEIRNELFLDEYTIMPNHLHAIIILNKTQIGSYGSDGTNGSHGSHGSHIETHGRASLQPNDQPTDQSQSNFVRKPKSISSFIGGYKSVINSKIDDYINNPKNWNTDKFNEKINNGK